MKCKNCGAELKYGKCEYCGSVIDDACYLVPEVKFTEEQVRNIIAKTPIVVPDEIWAIETKDGDVYLDDAENVTSYRDCGNDYIELKTKEEIKSEPLYLKMYDRDGKHEVKIKSLEHNCWTGVMRVYVGY